MAGIPVYSQSPISPAAREATSDESLNSMLAQSPESANEPITPSSSNDSLAAPPKHAGQRQRISSISARYHPAGLDSLQRPASLDTQYLTSPSSSALRTASPRRAIPPPPKVGEKLQHPSYYSPAPTPARTSPALAFVPLAGPQPSQSASLQSAPAVPWASPPLTSTMQSHPFARTPSTRPTHDEPTDDTMSPVIGDHPPGYVQNPYAADLVPSDNPVNYQGPLSPPLGYAVGSSFYDSDASGGLTKGLGIQASASSVLGSFSELLSPSGGRQGLLDGGDENLADSMWDTVGGWVKQVGRRVGEAEGEVWKKINGDS